MYAPAPAHPLHQCQSRALPHHRSSTTAVTCAKKGSGNKQNGKGSARRGKQTPRTTKPPPANQVLTPPLSVNVAQQLTSLERMAMPFWSTFCGMSNGEWRGQMAAFSPMTGAIEVDFTTVVVVACCSFPPGEAEPLSLDANNRPLLTLQTVTMERREANQDGADRIVRQIWRAEGESTLAADSGLDRHEEHAEPHDVEEIHQADSGLVFFDGGSYSLGPSLLGGLGVHIAVVCRSLQSCVCIATTKDPHADPTTH